MLIQKNDDINLLHTFDCGQCFRWNLEENGSYTGVVGDKVINLAEKDNQIITNIDSENFLNEYLDLNRDYSKLKNKLNKDIVLKKAIAHGSGIRILKQDPFETLVSFIISANNNIPRIKKIIESLSCNFGNKIEYNGNIYYSFPTPQVISRLTEIDLAPIKSGYRAGYIIDAAHKVATGMVDLNSIFKMSPDEGRYALKQIKGVGDKVADCVLLFAFQKYGVFPKDVWIKRILNNLYSVEEKAFDDFVNKKFGDLGGFAQQYLFYYGREFL